MDEKDKALNDAKADTLAALSEVTPGKKASLLRTPVFKVIAGLCLLFVVLGYFSQHAKSKAINEGSHPDSKSHSLTLNQNLAHLSALKEAEAKKEEEEQNRLRQQLKEAQKRRQQIQTYQAETSAHARPYTQPRTDAAKQTRMRAETNFINVDYGGQHGIAAMSNTQTQAGAVLAGGDANSQFVNQNNPVGFAKAGRLVHPDYTLAAGELIEATLETAIDSQLPGMVRALTLRDVYSLDAARVVVPKGSRLIGQYATGNIGAAQSRVLIAWTRVQLPNGVIATLNSPSTDMLGRAGLAADDINHHFLQRFGSSVLFSILGAYTANAGVNGLDGYNSASQYRMSLVQSFQKTANDTMNQNANITPTLTIHQGHQINVFVARDISFYDVMKGGNA